MGRELMTGYISFNGNPLSTITVASLADLGYTVSYANADPYTVSPLNLRMGPGAGDVRLLEMKPTATIKRVDADGAGHPGEVASRALMSVLASQVMYFQRVTRPGRLKRPGRRRVAGGHKSLGIPPLTPVSGPSIFGVCRDLRPIYGL